MAEALGTTNSSRVVDLLPNDANPFTPAYAVYEEHALARIALINFMDGQTAGYNVTLSIGGNQVGEPNDTPAQVKVKYVVSADTDSAVPNFLQVPACPICQRERADHMGKPGASLCHLLSLLPS